MIMNKKIIISLISLVLSIVLIFVFGLSQWSSIKVFRTELTQKKQVQTELNELLNKMNQIEEKYQEVTDEAQKMFLSLPREKDISYLLVHFETLASQNGLLLESINFGQIDKEKKQTIQQESDQSPKVLSNLPNFSVDLSMTGSYDAFKNYLTALEKSVRLMDVNSINFVARSRNSLSSDLGIFGFNLGINVYYLK